LESEKVKKLSFHAAKNQNQIQNGITDQPWLKIFAFAL